MIIDENGLDVGNVRKRFEQRIYNVSRLEMHTMMKTNTYHINCSRNAYAILTEALQRDNILINTTYPGTNCQIIIQ